MNKLIWYLGALVALIAILVLPSQLGYNAKHPTLNYVAEEPDIHIRNVGRYLEDGEIPRSIHHLKKAIETIREIESDVDSDNCECLDEAVEKLELVYADMENGEVNLNYMYETFELTLNSLAHAELEVSEQYAQKNEQKRAKRALGFAQMHIRNSLLIQKNLYDEPSEHSIIELRVMDEIDSLIENESISQVELTLKIGQIKDEVDLLIH